MDELIQKYMDGDLSEEEAAALSEALARDPELEADLRAFERALALAAQDVVRDPSAGFTDQVMERIKASGPSSAAAPQRREPFLRGVFGGARAWGMRLAWTAGFALVFALGFITAHQRGGDEGRDIVPPMLDPGVVTGSDARNAAYESPSPRLVRLVYVPQASDVDQVTVAGTFNGWDPEATAMRREGGVWVLQLVLPPDSYEYMFVEDGQRWVTDPLATQTRDDGFGRENAVLDLTM